MCVCDCAVPVVQPHCFREHPTLGCDRVLSPWRLGKADQRMSRLGCHGDPSRSIPDTFVSSAAHLTGRVWPDQDAHYHPCLNRLYRPTVSQHSLRRAVLDFLMDRCGYCRRNKPSCGGQNGCETINQQNIKRSGRLTESGFDRVCRERYEGQDPGA
jgi:hypothetical protein